MKNYLIGFICGACLVLGIVLLMGPSKNASTTATTSSDEKEEIIPGSTPMPTAPPELNVDLTLRPPDRPSPEAPLVSNQPPVDPAPSDTAPTPDQSPAPTPAPESELSANTALKPGELAPLAPPSPPPAPASQETTSTASAPTPPVSPAPAPVPPSAPNATDSSVSSLKGRVPTSPITYRSAPPVDKPVTQKQQEGVKTQGPTPQQTSRENQRQQMDDRTNRIIRQTNAVQIPR